MKIKVMIVDDEPIAAQSLEFMLKEERQDIEIVGLCYSGREAVEHAVLTQPDVAIMDIQMPGINGLEAMRQIKSRLPNTQFIVTTAYSDFQYAQQAIEIGTSDYLLKPVKEHELATAFDKSVNRIMSIRETLSASKERQQRMDKITPLIVEDFLQSLLPNSGSPERLIATASFLGYLDSFGYVMIAYVPFGESKGALEFFTATLKNYHCAETDIQNGKQAIIYVPKNSSTPENISQHQATELAETVLEQTREAGFHVCVGVGECYTGALHARRSCKEALFSLGVLKELNTKNSAINLMTYWNASSLPEGAKLMAEVNNYPETSNDLASEVTAIIDKADEYLANHYNEDVLLEDVAASVNLSPYYFSRFYKEHGGINFSEKLSQLRIDKAKQLLLTSNSSIKDIAHIVGYNDPNYFSKVFKKEVGVSASQYKDQLTKEN